MEIDISKISSEALQAYLNMAMREMSETDQAATSLLINRLSGKGMTDDDYLQEEFPDVDPAEVKQILRDYEDYKSQKGVK